MKIGFGLEPIKGLSLDLIIKLLRFIHLEHFEFNWRVMPKVDKVLDSLGSATTTFHLPIYNRDNYDFSTPNRNFDIQIAEFTSFINEQKDDLNIKYVLAHAPEDPNASYSLMFERLSEIDVPIVLENVVGQSDDFFVSFYRQAKENLGSVLAGHALDISHRYVNNWQTWLDIPKELISEIEYVHISDCTKTDDAHLPLGLGDMPYTAFFDFLKEIDYDGIILQELKPDGDQAPEIMKSSMKCIKPFSKFKYLHMWFRSIILRPLLRLQRKRFEKVIDRSADEIGYDYV